MPGKLLPTLLLITALCASAPAQSHLPVPALFLSDIHLDPFSDPTKAARLNAAPASEWPAILAAPDSPTRADAALQLQRACPARSVDTPPALWRSALRAIHTETAATHPRFVTISGDLLAHAFDCKYKALLPEAAHADYVAFTTKTIRYVMSSLEATLPATPIYLALGNNDSACTDYELAPDHDELLAETARIAAESLPAADRPAVLATFSQSGSFVAPLAGIPGTRIIVLDDLFESSHYTTCGGLRDPAPAQTQIDWLTAQLADAHRHNEHVWILSHIPPGVDLYATARRLTNVCGGGKATMFLSSDKLSETLAANADTVRLALFGHTHSDEMKLIAAADDSAGVPVKLTASISPVNGNRPTFTLAKIDPASATLEDWTVFIASNSSGVATTWTKEYTFSTAYHKPAFNPAALSELITGFQTDPKADAPASKAYLKYFFPGDISSIIQFAWPEYSCSMNHDSATAFASCVCAIRSVVEPSAK